MNFDYTFIRFYLNLPNLRCIFKYDKNLNSTHYLSFYHNENDFAVKYIYEMKSMNNLIIWFLKNCTYKKLYYFKFKFKTILNFLYINNDYILIFIRFILNKFKCSFTFIGTDLYIRNIFYYFYLRRKCLKYIVN